MSLTDIQKNYLLKRSEADSPTRSRYDFKLAQKLKGALDDVRDAYWILRFLPSQSVQKVITDDQIFSILEVSTMLMRLMDYKKIRSIDDRSLVVFRDDAEGRIQSISPSETDIQRAKKLYDHLHELEAFVDPKLLDRVPIPDYEPNCSGTSEDFRERILKIKVEDEKIKKIKMLMAAGVSDIEQITKEVNCSYMLVDDVIEGHRRQKELQEEIVKLEQDSTAIQKIKDLWADGLYNTNDIANAIGYSRSAVVEITNRMMRDKEIPPDWVIVPGGDFPKLDTISHQRPPAP